jgi:hypothetical protein
MRVPPWSPLGNQGETFEDLPEGELVGYGIDARSQNEGRRARHLSPGEGPKGTKKGPNRTDAPGLTRTDGRPVFRGKTMRGIWSRVGAEPPIAASIPATSNHRRSTDRPRG